MRQAFTSGLRRSKSGTFSETVLNTSHVNLLGKGNLQFAQTPTLDASSMESQRSMPLLWTMITSLTKGEERGSGNYCGQPLYKRFKAVTCVNVQS